MHNSIVILWNLIVWNCLKLSINTTKMPQNEGLQVSWRLSLRSNKKNWINKTINKINKLIFKNNISDLQELTSEKITYVWNNPKYTSPNHWILRIAAKFSFLSWVNLRELINLYTPWNHQKTLGFLMISWA